MRSNTLFRSTAALLLAGYVTFPHLSNGNQCNVFSFLLNFIKAFVNVFTYPKVISAGLVRVCLQIQYHLFVSFSFCQIIVKCVQVVCKYLFILLYWPIKCGTKGGLSAIGIFYHSTFRMCRYSYILLYDGKLHTYKHL